jgi:hypothetical protein
MAPTVIPMRRSGKEISQTTGNRSKARIASGQQSTNKMHHSSIRISNFMLDSLLCFAAHFSHYNISHFRAGPLQIA